jgi:hypothetical protein
MDLSHIDWSKVEEPAERGLLDAGWYKIAWIKGETKTTKAGTGSYLELTGEILEGPAQGRKIWERLNLKNPNPTAVKIAQQSLSKIATAIGIVAPKHSDELLNRQLMVEVIVKSPSERDRANGYDQERNEIKAFASVDGGQSYADAKAGTVAPTSSTPPWKR